MSKLIVDATAVGSLRLGIRIAIVWLSGSVEAGRFSRKAFFAKERDIKYSCAEVT
jgi:hypothetical protein